MPLQVLVYPSAEIEAVCTYDSGWEFVLNDDQQSVLPKTLANIIKEHRAYCPEDANGRLQIPVTAIEKTDLTGNGQEDTIFDLGKVRCDGSSTGFSGSGGSLRYLIVGDKVTSFAARSLTVSHAFGDGYPIVLLSVHGSSCGGAGATNCVVATVWGGDKFEVLQTN